MELREIESPLQGPTVEQLLQHGGAFLPSSHPATLTPQRSKACWWERSLVLVRDLISQPSIPINCSLSQVPLLLGGTLLV